MNDRSPMSHHDLPSRPPRPLPEGEVFAFRHAWGPMVRAFYDPVRHEAWALYTYFANERLPEASSLYKANCPECPASWDEMNVLRTWWLQPETDGNAVARFEAVVARG